MSRIARFVLPFGVLILGFLIFQALVRSKPRVMRKPPEVIHPLVRVVAAAPRDLSFTVRAEGTVLPRTETTLAAQVAAAVVTVAPSFEVGGFFERGDVLVALDARDYEAAVEQIKARLAGARLRLAQEEAEARVAQEEWRHLGEGEADSLVMREPQLAEARAALAAEQAALKKARLDLERTRIHAPFAGRVRRKLVDLGQYLTPGQPVVTLHAIDYAEVRLPVPDHELAFLDLPLTYRDGQTTAADPSRESPEVILSADFGGRRYRWRGKIVRTEGELDPRSRMLYLVARVADPYGRGDDPGRPPLMVGMFVEAEILGRRTSGTILLPREALRNENQVLVVDGEDRLRFRTVEVIRVQGESVVIGGGLATGERVCVSTLDVVVDGMQVRAIDAEEAVSP